MVVILTLLYLQNLKCYSLFEWHILISNQVGMYTSDHGVNAVLFTQVSGNTQHFVRSCVTSCGRPSC